MVRILIRLVLVALLVPAQQIVFARDAQPVLPCAHEDRACAQRALRGHVAQKLAFWQRALARPLEERIGPAPAEVVQFIGLDVIAQGYSNKPHAAAPAADFVRDVRDAIAEMPAPVLEFARRKLTGIHFVSDFGGTAYADQVFDAAGGAIAGFVVLDPAVLDKQTANAWATWKENTPFEQSPGFRLVAQIRPPAEDSRRYAIQYILLHEFGHLFAIGAGVHPSWNDAAKDAGPTARYQFFSQSWMVAQNGSRYDTLRRDSFARRDDVVYYFGARLPAARMAGVYRSLEGTSFASLYAATNPFDDFAEAFVTYVHTVMLGKPFEVRIYRDDKPVLTFGSCWEQARCARKKAILESLLGARR